jgi:E2/UBC family protein E
MTLLEEQVEILRSQYPDVIVRHLPSGAALIVLPRMPLVDGWSKKSTAVSFLAPVGYPHAKPDCFWTDGDLKLASGATPVNAAGNPIPEINEGGHLWFSWHTAQWNPNRDSLLTYVNVIKNRLRDLR